ncbi:molybdopterin-dependent oxidoreductase [Microvirga sp. ACRRW]|uniref:molybdopterin-dependent oxidoreductase n=1 Tax=Microvirga sp. ACRRW TaxID=2918205 RepID=UPI001EF63346|nr:molybdopterin-dependent oxidoreductase [Microvirga sp. ACRRW]MCG7394154.1 molybdopterin-dependent oxidoreductase [Microvirga sp. ACRRW]
MRYVMLLGMLATLMFGPAFAQAAEPLPRPKGPVLLTISGKIEQTNAPGQAQFDREMLEALGKASFTTGSVLTDKKQLYEGVPLRAVLDRVGAKGKTLLATAHNNYKIDIPSDDVKYDPIIAMRVDGEVLKLRDKGPLWIVYPRDAHAALQSQLYDSRWIWQLNKLHIE